MTMEWSPEAEGRAMKTWVALNSRSKRARVVVNLWEKLKGNGMPAEPRPHCGSLP